MFAAIIASALYVGVGAGISPAAADSPSFTYKVSDTVLYSGCSGYKLSYAASTAAASTTWNLTVSDSEDFPEPLTLTGTSGVATFTLCDNKAAPGEFYVLGDIDQCDETQNCVRNYADGYKFHLRAPHHQTKLTATPTRPRFNHVVSLKTRTLIESPGGWTPTPSEIVLLEINVRGQWKQLGTTKQVTDRRGYAVKRYRWNVRGPVRIRAVQTTSYDVHFSTSRPVTIRAR